MSVLSGLISSWFTFLMLYACRYLYVSFRFSSLMDYFMVQFSGFRWLSAGMSPFTSLFYEFSFPLFMCVHAFMCKCGHACAAAYMR